MIVGVGMRERFDSGLSAAEAGFLGSGADRNRTDDLLVANQALSRLSYGPVPAEFGGANKVHDPAPYRKCPDDLTMLYVIPLGSKHVQYSSRCRQEFAED